MAKKGIEVYKKKKEKEGEENEKKGKTDLDHVKKKREC